MASGRYYYNSMCHCRNQYKYYGERNSTNDLRLLIVLVLVLLQFSNRKYLSKTSEKESLKCSIIDEKILFIITLHFLICC